MIPELLLFSDTRAATFSVNAISDNTGFSDTRAAPLLLG